MHEEHFLLDERGIAVSTLRVIVGDTSCVLRHVTAFRVVRRPHWAAGVLIGALLLGAGLVADDRVHGARWIGVGAALVAIALGVYLTTYTMHLEMASGRSAAFSTRDRALADRIEAALERALAETRPAA